MRPLTPARRRALRALSFALSFLPFLRCRPTVGRLGEQYGRAVLARECWHAASLACAVLAVALWGVAKAVLWLPAFADTHDRVPVAFGGVGGVAWVVCVLSLFAEWRADGRAWAIRFPAAVRD